MRLSGWLLTLGLAVSLVAAVSPAAALADDVAPVAGEASLPPRMSLPEAIAIFRTHGIDLLIADAAAWSAEGDLASAERVPNPNLSVAAGPTFNYEASAPTCFGCSKLSLQWGVGDNGAIVDSLSGKRALRSHMMGAALAVARLNRVDAQRVLESMVKQAYVGVSIARADLDLSRSIAASLQQSLDLAKVRYPSVITEADLARTEVQKLEGDAAVTNAVANYRQAQAALALLLGARTVATDFEVDPLDFTVPASLDGVTEPSLVALALRSRPDIRARAYDRTRALALLDLSRRQRFPDIAFNAVYTSVGSGASAASPSALGFGATANLPIFYQQNGEITKAQADVMATTLTEAKAESIVATDVGAAYAGYVSARRLVERMKTGGLLDRAKAARDILDKQYLGGTASLVDFLDAQRTYIAINEEYINDLGAYWSSIYQLEQALGTEVR